MNVHHQRWLHHSNGDTPVGTDLKVLCDSLGLFQLVRDPTRYQYLLDLAITDVPGCTTQVLPRIADHNAVLVKVPVPKTEEKVVKRRAWLMDRAEWGGLRRAVAGIDWAPLRIGTAQDALNYFMEMLWYSICRFIPLKDIEIRKKSRPWLNSRCEQAISKKNSAEDTADFEVASKECAEVLGQEHQLYVEKLRIKIADLPRGSKQWWRLNRELLLKKAKVSSIPPLKGEDGCLSNAYDKANLFAKTFSDKAALPHEEVDTPFFGINDFDESNFVPLRTRDALKAFKALKEDKATGPDKLSAVILKKLGDLLAVPFTRICRRLLQEGCWPLQWRYHLIVPIYKKSSSFQAGNYRGVHLTSILSKIAERIIGKRLLPILRSRFGGNQWGFTPGLGSRDLVTMLMMSWILAICRGKKVGTYLSDISGAFDRVFKEFMMAKLAVARVGTQFLNFLDAYLAPRCGHVAVEGELSDEFDISNSVFQGTVC